MALGACAGDKGAVAVLELVAGCGCGSGRGDDVEGDEGAVEVVGRGDDGVEAEAKGMKGTAMSRDTQTRSMTGYSIAKDRIYTPICNSKNNF